MNKVDSRTSGQESLVNTTENSLLRDLDSEAKSLSTAVVGRLASARRQAIMISPAHPVPAECGKVQLLRNNRSAGVELRPPLTAGRSLHDYLVPLFRTHPVAAMLAGCCVAAFAATLLLQIARLPDNQTERIALATADVEQRTNNEVVDANAPFVRAASYDALSIEQVPVIASQESLDMLGSIDFLLWLDSLQS